MKISSVPPQTRPVSYLGLLFRLKVRRARLLFFHHLARGLPDFSLDAAAADGAGDGAVVAYQHFGGLERRDGAATLVMVATAPRRPSRRSCTICS